MKTNHLPENEGPLREVLRQWTVDIPLPPRFKEQVWQRIACSERKTRSSVWVQMLNLIEVTLPRPKFAYSYVAILLLLGVVGGSWAAQRQTGRLDEALGSRYVQSIDPYQRLAVKQ